MANVKVWTHDGKGTEVYEKVKRYPFFPAIRAKRILAHYGYEARPAYEHGIHIINDWHIIDKRNGEGVGTLKKERVFGKPDYLGASKLPTTVRARLRNLCGNIYPTAVRQ
ncbi:MAG: hypothetical protein HY517_00210 [Candidatus Aenigmarchaeota archaeon]|nr:hypothetical protein [Candidatus Aenigmarchaeota archaeon]